jgi:hypothetical protein
VTTRPSTVKVDLRLSTDLAPDFSPGIPGVRSGHAPLRALSRHLEQRQVSLAEASGTGSLVGTSRHQQSPSGLQSKSSPQRGHCVHWRSGLAPWVTLSSFETRYQPGARHDAPSAAQLRSPNQGARSSARVNTKQQRPHVLPPYFLGSSLQRIAAPLSFIAFTETAVEVRRARGVISRVLVERNGLLPGDLSHSR